MKELRLIVSGMLPVKLLFPRSMRRASMSISVRGMLPVNWFLYSAISSITKSAHHKGRGMRKPFGGGHYNLDMQRHVVKNDHVGPGRTSARGW